MSSPLVAEFRQHDPEGTAGWSDDDLTLLLGDQRPDLLREDAQFYADYRRLRPGDIGRETRAALAAGVLDRLPATAYGVGALAADSFAQDAPVTAGLLGIDRAGDFLRGQIVRNQQEAAERIAAGGGRTVARAEDVRGVRDALLYALPMFAENAPQLGVSLGAGGLAALASGGAAAPILAAGLTSIAQNAGDLYADLGTREDVDRRTAIDAAATGGMAAGLLDTAGLLLPASRLLPGLGRTAIGQAVARVAGRGGWAGGLQGFVTDAATEGGTEALQELIAIAAEERATGRELSPNEVRSRVLNAAAGGAIVGGPVGAATGALPLRTPEAGGQQPETIRTPQSAVRLPRAPLPAEIEAEPVVSPDEQTTDPRELISDAVRGLNAQEPVDAEAAAMQQLQEAQAVLAETPAITAPAAPVEPAPVAAAEPSAPAAPAAPAPAPPPPEAEAETTLPAAEATSSTVPIIGDDVERTGVPPTPPAPFTVTVFNAQGLPDSWTSDTRGRKDRFGIVLEKDGQAHGRRVIRTGGKVFVADAAELAPGARKRTTTRTLAELEKAGYRVLFEPFQLDRPMPDFRIDAPVAQWDTWMGDSIQTQQALRDAIANGRQDEVITRALASADPDGATLQGVLAVQDLVSAEAGGSFAHALLGLTTRIDTRARARDQLAANTTLKKIAAAQQDPTVLLWKRDGRVFGLFTAEEWRGLAADALAGNAAAVRGRLLEKFTERGDAGATEAAGRLRAWAQTVVQEGARKQAGNSAYAGQGATRPVETPLVQQRDGETTVADVPVPDETADIPLSSLEGRAALRALGLADNEIDFITSEIVDGTREEVADIISFGLDDELGSFRELVRNADDPRGLVRNAINAILDHHEKATAEGPAGARADEANSPDTQARGEGPEQAGAAQAAGAQGLTPTAVARLLPGLGPPAPDLRTGLQGDKVPDSSVAVAFNVGQAVRASLAVMSAYGAPVSGVRLVAGEWAQRHARAPRVRVINDPAATVNGHGIRGVYADGEIWLNAAYLTSAENAEAVLNHEWAHSLLDSDAGRAALIQFATREIPEAQLADLRRKYARSDEESATDYRLRLIEEWVAANAETEIPTFRRIVEAVRAWLAGLGLVELTNEEAARAMLRALRGRRDRGGYVGAERLSVTEPLGVRDNPANAVNINVAAINHAAEVEAEALAAVRRTGTLAQRTAEWFREQFGFADPDALRQVALSRTDPATGAPIAGNARQTFGDFQSTANASRARILAYQAAQTRKTTLAKQLAADMAEHERLSNRQQRIIEDFLAAHRDYLNAEGLTAIIQKGVRQLIARERRLTGRIGTQMGAVMQALKELDARADELIDRDYAPVFAKLFRGRELTGRNLFDLLDTLVNQTGIDFRGMKVTEIRQAIAERFAANPDRTELGLLIAATPQSRALLATVVAYAKTNERVMLQLERRRQRNAEDRVRLQQALDQLIQERAITDLAVSDLRKTATLEERARVLYVQANRERRAGERKLERLQARMAAAQAAMPAYQAALEELGRSMNLRPHVTFADGMTYHVPPRVDAGGDELRQNARRLSLNSAGAVTDRAALERDLQAMTEWMQLREARAGNGDPAALDGDYFVIKAQRDELLAGGFFDGDLRKVDTLTKTLAFQPVTRIAEAFGTATGRLISQMFNREASVAGELRASGERLARAFEQKRDALIAVLQRDRPDRDLTLDRFYALFYDPALSIIEKERGLLELGLSDEQMMHRLHAKILAHWRGNAETAPYVADKDQAVLRALRGLVDAAAEASAFYNRANEQAGVGVKDARLIVTDLRGETTEGIRDSLPQGIRTFSRRLNRGIRLTYGVMRAAGWGGVPGAANSSFADAIKGAADIYNTQGAAGLNQRIARYFTPEVIQGFVRPMIETDTYSPFDAPALGPNDLRPEADPARVAEAWEQAQGNVVAFADRLYDLHDGTGDRGAFVEATLQRLADYFGQLDELMDPTDTGTVPPTLRGMVRNVMIDARVLERWPTGWSEYVAFDRSTNHNLATRVAAQIAFGRDQERLAAAFDTLRSEVDAQLAEYRAWEAEVATAGLSGRRAEKAMLDRFTARHGKGGAAEYRRLRDLAGRSPLIAGASEMIRRYYGSRDTDLGATRFGAQLTSTIAAMMLNQPGTALLQLSELFSPIIQSGVSKSTLRQVLRNLRYWGEDLAGSLGQAVGLTLLQGSRLTRQFIDDGLADPLGARSLVEQLGDIGHDRGRRGDRLSTATRFLRKVPQAAGLGLTGGGIGRFTAFRPFAPFTAASIATHRANTISLWARAEDMVRLGMEHFRANPARAADPAYEPTAKDLGLRGLEAESFERLTTRMREGYDLPLGRLIREAQAAGQGAPLLSRRTRALLHGMAINEITLEGNLATMTPKAFTNSIARFILPMWGWPIRRAMQAAGLRLTPQGRMTMQAVGQGLLALAVMTAGGLAFSVLVDEYNEELLRKARNTRSARELPRLIARGEAREALMTLVEATNRIGTVGIFGEVLNTAVNLGQSDARPLSLDQRVVMANALLSIARATSNVVAQDFDVDYANVVRPYISALGGNGALQFWQLSNNLLGLDNAESRFVAKLNAQNYLRVAGRGLGLEVRSGQSGFTTPTPLTPIMTRMVLAAYGNSRADFVAAWREAIAKARELGKEDPAAYVRDSFASRHPLRTVFRSLSEDDYRRLVRALPGDGRTDVEEAVRFFNTYLESLEGRAYFGSTGGRSANPLQQMRREARGGVTVEEIRRRALGQ